MSAAEWEPGDDICPPWWPWHGPRPKWWDEVIIDAGQQVFIGISLINAAARVSNPGLGIEVARLGAQIITHNAPALNKALEGAKGQ